VLVTTALTLATCGSSSTTGESTGDTSEPGSDAGGETDATGKTDAGIDQISPDLAASACAARAAKLQAALDKARKSPLAAIGVATADCPTVTIASGSGAKTDALYRIGSITKTFVAATIVSLEREGKLSLVDTLDAWSLPVPNASGISVRTLLNHTSGLFDYTQDPGFGPGLASGKEATPEQLVALATQHTPLFLPGTGWAYSNTNYILLGMIIQKLTGATASAAIRARTIAPAHLEHVFFAGEETIVGSLAPGYSAQGLDVTQDAKPSWTWTAGAIVASASDLADWVVALHGGSLLDAAGTAELTAQPVPTGEAGMSYGLGAQIYAAFMTGGAGEAVGHDGDTAGYHSVAFYFPARKTGVAVIVDQDGVDPYALYFAVSSALLSP
jgi:D-alanyl-D-alanine carboxypeptidase